MAGRPFTTRLRVDALLKTTTPLHVGGLGHDPDVDLPVAVDGQSRLYVPGTSLAGVCRSWMIGAGTTDRLDALWGYAKDVEGTASRIFVRDGLIFGPDRSTPLPETRLESRTSVGIDRYTGTAARGFLYSRAVVPVGSFVRVELDLESSAETAEQDGSRLRALLDAFAAGRVAVGAASTRGLGRVRLEADARVERHDFASPEGLVALLRGKAPLVDRATLVADPDLTPRESLDVTIAWTPRAPVMVRADRDGVALDTVPLTGAVDHEALRLVLPGASTKGTMRSHAERLMRTVSPQRAPGSGTAGGRPPEPAGIGAEFRAQLAQFDLVSALFGAAPDPTNVQVPDTRTFVVPRNPRQSVAEEHVTAASTSATPTASQPDGVGAVAVADCYSSTELDEVIWRSVVTATKLIPEQRGWLQSVGIAQADHVAIDRWTGGAADGLLFTVAEPWKVSWEPICLRVDLTRLGPRSDLALALLMLVLRDLRDGRLPLGGSVNRGFGDVTASVTVAVGDAASEDLDSFLAGDYGRRVISAWQNEWNQPEEAA